MQKILVTGANGFVGGAVCAELAQRGLPYTAAVRQGQGPHTVAVGTIDGSTDWSAALAGCSRVIHLAARAHVLRDTVADPLTAFRQTNVDGTLLLAAAALRAGVTRFVFVSSVGVNGNLSTRPFTESDQPAPGEDYALSKLEAELALTRALAGSAMELVIVRPPLVYGPDCPGNFLRLLKLVSSPLPLPFGAISARRSFVSVWNLADFLVTCAVHERAAGETFLISDTEDVALPELLRALAVGMGRQAALWPLPPALLGTGARMLGKGALFDKLCGTLTVDAGHAQRVLGWRAPVPLAEGLRRTGHWYAHRQHAGS